MKLTSAALRAFQNALSHWGFATHISLYQEEHYGADEILELRVNWGGIGGQTPDETYAFIDNLKTAARICEAINEQHYEIVRVKLESVFETEEDFGENVERLIEYLKDDRCARIVYWLDDHCIA